MFAAHKVRFRRVAIHYALPIRLGLQARGSVGVECGLDAVPARIPTAPKAPIKHWPHLWLLVRLGGIWHDDPF